MQLQLTEDKNQAAVVQSRAQEWWQEQPPSEYPALVDDGRASDSPVTIVWKTPFYRVRLGPFATEDEAETVLEAAQETFSEAFVAPERINDPE